MAPDGRFGFSWRAGEGYGLGSQPKYMLTVNIHEL